MTSSVRPTRAIAQPDDDFRDFVVGFADPLARLAFALTVELPALSDVPATSAVPAAPDVLAANALARVRRRWHDANDSGAPELIAIEALLSTLARRRGTRRRYATSSPSTTDALMSGGPLETDDDVDIDLVRAALWPAFQQLPLRHRVPLVFADPSVVSRRLAGLDVPASFGTQRRQEALLDAGLLDLRTALRVTPATAGAAEVLTDDEIVVAVGEAIREHASRQRAPVDPYPLVVERARQSRRRTGFIAAAVVVVLAVGAVGVVRVSTPLKPRAGGQNLHAASAVVPSLAGAPPHQVLRGGGQFVPANGAGPVVTWPVRGNAAGEPVLLANVQALFLADHPDVTGPAQVLLAADTPAFRVAYVTATSASGVVQAWFYGPVGSTELTEGAASFGGSLVADASVLAAGLVDSAGHTELVVIAPPTTTGMSVADFDFSRPIGAFQALPESGGVAVKEITTGSVATLDLRVIAGGQQLEVDHMPVLNLGTPAALVAVHEQPSVGVERGQADPILLAEALQVAALWAHPSASAAVHPVVLWGGTDAVGTKLLVLRVKTQVFDLEILEWSGDAPGLHGEYLVDSASPDVPVAFAYRSGGRARIGVLAPTGAATAALELLGRESPQAPFDATGFASIPLSGAGGLPGTVNANASPPPSNDFTGGLDATVDVALFDASGHPLASLTVPPTA